MQHRPFFMVCPGEHTYLEENVLYGPTAIPSGPGSIDDVRIYNTALSLAEIAYLAGRTAPLHVPF